MLDNIEISAILKGVLVLPFAKKIGVKILCNTKAGKPKAYIASAEAVFLLSIFENSPLSNNIVIIGILIGHIINYINNFNKLHDKNKKYIKEKSSNNCLLTKIGKNTLILYIIHLPILYIVTTLFFK